MSQLIQLELRRLRAIVEGDIRALEQLHAPDFVLCTPSGTLWDRERYLGGLTDGSIRYHRFDPDGPMACIEGDVVGVVRYRSALSVSIGGQEPGYLECWHMDAYQRADSGEWQCRWSQATDTIRD